MGCAKGYLRDVRSAEQALEHLQELEQRQRDKMDLNGVQYRAEPGSPNAYGDAIPDGVAKLTAIQGEIANQRRIAEERQSSWLALITRMDYDQWDVLNRYYVEGWTWARIGSDMGITKAQELRNAGLVELYDLMPATDGNGKVYRPGRQPAV